MTDKADCTLTRIEYAEVALNNALNCNFIQFPLLTIVPVLSLNHLPLNRCYIVLFHTRKALLRQQVRHQ